MKTPPHPSDRLARFCIWSVAHQDLIAGHLRIYIAGGVGIITFFYIGGLLTPEHFALTLIGSGAGIAGLVVALVRARRTVLLRIHDPALRQLALMTMRAYIAQREPLMLRARPAVERQTVVDCRHGQCRG